MWVSIMCCQWEPKKSLSMARRSAVQPVWPRCSPCGGRGIIMCVCVGGRGTIMCVWGGGASLLLCSGNPFLPLQCTGTRENHSFQVIIEDVRPEEMEERQPTGHGSTAHLSAEYQVCKVC